MHIPDGFVNAPVSIAGGVVAVAGLALCSGNLAAARFGDGSADDRQIPLAGLAAAFFLVLEAPIFPIGIGTGGHLLGGVLAMSLLGPWLGPVVIAVVLVVQALFAGDGGVTALGVNAVNMALLPALVGYPLILVLRGLLPRTRTAIAVSCGIAATLSVIAGSALYSLEYAVGGATAVPASTVAITTIGTYSVIALFEGVVTGLIVAASLRLRPDLVRVGRHLTTATA